MIIIISILRDQDIEYDNILSMVKMEKYFAIKS
jgi:hypothetical protein